MKIGIFGSCEYTIPPPPTGIYASLEIVYSLAEGLEKKGHDVTLFAPEGSKTAATLVDFDMDPLIQLRKKERIDWEVKGLIAYEQLMVSQIYGYLDKEKFDIFHSHNPLRTLPFVNYSNIPTVFTFHTPVKESYQLAYKGAVKSNFKYYPISISKKQQENAKNINWSDNVYNGIDLDKFSFSERGGEELISIGRIHPDKGTHIAIDVAKKTNVRLRIAGDFVKEDKISTRYWQEKIKNSIDNSRIKLEGFIPYSKIEKEYKTAKALLFPIQWEEPFGLVVVEAGACGTPVVAFNRGSMSELIKDGVNGFLIKPGDTQGMIEAVNKINKMDKSEYLKLRKSCREHVEKNFSLQKMIDNYEKIYQKVINSYK